MKKPVLIYSAGDVNNFPYAVMFWNSLTKFHKPADVSMVFFTNEKRPEELAKLPKGVKVEDITPYLQDGMFWYRQKPLLAERYIDNYECVIGMDCDQIVLGDLSYIWKTQGYDAAVVVNWNRADPQLYGFVEIQRLGIPPPEYYNCGLVALRSKQFVHHWKVLCFSPEYQYMQYKEQDTLNILAHFGNYNIRNLDAGDGVAKMSAWWGIISKGEYGRAELKGEDIVIPKGLGDTPFPPAEMTLKVIHAGGGNVPNKMNYQAWFGNEKIIDRINYLVSAYDEKKHIKKSA